MENITTYKSEDGKEQPIAQMNNFHLVNAVLKLANKVGAVGETETQPELLPTVAALKAELLNRLAPAKKLEGTPTDITVCLLEAVVMPNGEIISAGKSLGWMTDEIGKFLTIKK